ncbi:hypothetical protein G999_02696 [Escherichia coli UMEA 3893-1]|uniref:hypothetical protein n=1 Tax=Escherichia coli TaxID=562 RepID=UPI00038F437B|nr:hypothetical protein [Escherichia coli]ERA20529.1 hypothetical protein G999_02696 [Escherichia coli UMEA 3893-1]
MNNSILISPVINTMSRDNSVQKYDGEARVSVSVTSVYRDIYDGIPALPRQDEAGRADACGATCWSKYPNPWEEVQELRAEIIKISLTGEANTNTNPRHWPEKTAIIGL